MSRRWLPPSWPRRGPPPEYGGRMPAPLDPPQRLLCGPGPSNVEPAALAAMQRPILGHLDPDFQELLLDVVGMLRRTYQASAGVVLPLQATGTSGMECG